MAHTRTSYSPEEKMDIILSILSRKSTIQKISEEKGIAATLISLWKKQALEAVEARFQAQPKGRPRVVREARPSCSAEQVKAARNEMRAAKIKASHLENSLRDAREKLARFEAQLAALASAMGCKVVKEASARKTRKPRNHGKA